MRIIVVGMKIFKGSFLENLQKVIFYIIVFCIIFFIGFFGYRVVKKSFFYPLKYKDYVLEYSKEFNLDSKLVFSTIKVESSFNKKAVSSRGAKGLMQITDSTGEFIAVKLQESNYDLFNEQTNIKFGCYYLRYLLDRFDNLTVVLCAYNAGEGNVSKWLNTIEYSKDGKTLVKIPFKETEEYVKKIYKSFEKYKNLYGKFLDKS